MTKRLKILHLEDDPKDAELVSSALAAEGLACDILRVDSREGFTAHLEKANFDLILSDYGLPAFDGLTALSMASEKHPEVPFLLVSGTLGEEAAIESMKKGAHDYVLKHRLERLAPAVQRALKEKEEQALRQKAERRLAEAQQLAHLGAWDWDIATGRVVWTEEHYRIFGYEPGSFEPSYPKVMERIHPEDRSAVEEAVNKALQDHQPFVFTFRLLRENGEIRHIQSRGEVVLDKNGQPGTITGTAQDVTEWNRLENQLRQSQKMEAVGRLAGGVAHDFNNILTVIIGYTDFLHTQLTDETLRTELGEIKKAGERAAALTNQLLAFSRRQILQPRVVDINAVVADMEKMLRRLIGENIELLSFFHPALDKVKVDPGQIEQVILNLAVNARDAMPEGGKIMIETSNVMLDQDYARQHQGALTSGPYVMIAISDTGHGMSEEVRSHLFEPFFTTKVVGKGTGLGLSTVYGIVKQSGGYIWCYTEEGKGTTFKAYFPKVDACALDPEAGALAPAAVARGTETILLVEDEDGVRRLVEHTLKKNGYKVLSAAGPREALLMADTFKEPVHLMLTDVVMPHMSGRELADRLSKDRPAMKVLYMSGYTDHAILDQGILEPGIAFLQKPFTPDGLVRRVWGILRPDQAEA